MLDREAILGGSTLREVDVEVPEFGGTVVIRELGAAELVDAYSNLPKDQPPHIQGAMVLVRTIYVRELDGQLVRMFKDEDGPAFAKVSKKVYRRLEKAFDQLHGGGTEGESGVTGV